VSLSWRPRVECSPLTRTHHHSPLDPPRVFQLYRSHHGLLNVQSIRKEKVIQDWISWNCQQLGLPIPHMLQFKDHACTCDRFAIDEYDDHLHSCTQHAGATTGAHEHILTAVQRLLNQSGYATERKNVPHSRRMKKADLHVKDFRLEGIHIRDVIDVTAASSTAHALILLATERHHTPITTARSMQPSKRSLTTTNTITASTTSSSFRPS